MGKTVHARDWRRLDNLSPTYAKTHFKIMDNMLQPVVPMKCKVVTVPKVVYYTVDRRTMEEKRRELDVFEDQAKKTQLLNRLEIWGSVNAEEQKKLR